MLKIGLLGGMSWESSAEYYRLLNTIVRERLGGLHSADCVLRSVDFADVETMQASGDWPAAGELLGIEARRLQDAGAQLLLLCTNTMHKVADRIEAAVDIELLNLIDTTAAAVQRAGLSRIGLLATKFTMEEDFYRDRLAHHGIDVVLPSAADRDVVHTVIYDELCRGIVAETSRRAYQRIIAELVAGGAQGIVLGCTEIELLISQADSAVPVFPTTRLHVEAAVTIALQA